MARQDTVILGYARTPMGAMQGGLSSLPSPKLGATAISAAMDRAGVDGDSIDRVYMGCVLTAGLGQAPARQSALGAGVSTATPCTTVGKVCGSGMEAIILGHYAIQAGDAAFVVSGGMESMSQAPYLLPQHRGGSRIGHAQTFDSMFHDGLQDAYDVGRLMGSFGDEVAEQYQFTREDQDAYAIESLSRACAAQKDGAFDREIVEVEVPGKVETILSVDEAPGKARPEKIPHLKPAFNRDGTVTPANASSISDGAAALVIGSADAAAQKGLTPIARIVATAGFAGKPSAFPSAPVPAIRDVLAKAGWKAQDVDLFEVNEAFAMVAMIAMKELNIPREKMNVNGGAVALGHPIGASGARIVTTLVAALQNRGLKRGVASLCIGGGEATALAIELI